MSFAQFLVTLVVPLIKELWPLWQKTPAEKRLEIFLMVRRALHKNQDGDTSAEEDLIKHPPAR